MLRQGCAWYSAILLWLSGIQHVANKYLFLGTILDYQLVPTQLAVVTAAVLPWLHLMLAAVLIAPNVRFRSPFAATAILGLLFVMVQATVLVRGISVDCSCFGAMTERPVGIASLGVAGSLFATALIGSILTPRLSVIASQMPAVESHSVATAPDLKVQAEDTPRAAGISIVVPVYNELSTIQRIIEKVSRVAADHNWDYEILIVDDGSSDGTREVVAGFVGRDRIRVLTHDKNRGKGAAIRTALTVATRDLTIIQDADLEYDPTQISCLIEAMNQPHVDVVFGSRVLGGRASMGRQRRNIYAAGVFVLNVAVRILYGLRVTDEATCYKLFRTADLHRMQLTCERFEFCPEVTAKACRLGLSIVEVPISYTPRSTTQGKKIGFRDALWALQTLWELRHWTPSTTASH